ncbi:hypothetical protein BC938DRAFT_480191 [Jimgerdemannia flammicorona]|uniref:Uncharacterized protein n=1 Tax=Jimgerdemannia flammicorona TaxID=994334 RepID=A0A433QXG3_9FUNG|nr:hypothetical protein BC938DRAFT_480191 [Jimgerdemannia flammicorona]
MYSQGLPYKCQSQSCLSMISLLQVCRKPDRKGKTAPMPRVRQARGEKFSVGRRNCELGFIDDRN